MVISQLKEGTVALAGNDRKQPAHVVLGMEGNHEWWRGVLPWLHESIYMRVFS